MVHPFLHIHHTFLGCPQIMRMRYILYNVEILLPYITARLESLVRDLEEEKLSDPRAAKFIQGCARSEYRYLVKLLGHPVLSGIQENLI